MVLEIYNSTGTDLWFEAMICDTVSHLCHNAHCSDPFHLVKEPGGINMSRRECIDAGCCLGAHENGLECRLGTKEDWKKTYSECED